MTICVVGDTEDLSCVYFAWAARRAGHRVLELNEERLGSTWSFAFGDPPAAGGVIESDASSVEFADLVGVFARFAPEPDPPPGIDLDPLALERFRAERRTGLHQLLDRLPCPVANRPSAGRSNGSKPLHMGMLAAAGFRVPPWIVSNERARVVAFVESCAEPPIYKAVCGLRSRVRRLDDTLLKRLEDGTSPVLVQAYVPGIDVRVHVADRVCLGTAVRGLGVDYRFDGSRSYEAKEVPVAVARLCRDVARQEGLVLAGFDFRVCEDEWFCLEVNPMPSFIPYQWATGQPIAETVLQAFTSRAPNGTCTGGTTSAPT
ncbi:MAG: hypothetical protein M3296_06075 [Actinomycetota bacterium]|nr:hypothetical protein [Actinomycetota bacterium]